MLIAARDELIPLRNLFIVSTVSLLSSQSLNEASLWLNIWDTAAIGQKRITIRDISPAKKKLKKLVIDLPVEKRVKENAIDFGRTIDIPDRWSVAIVEAHIDFTKIDQRKQGVLEEPENVIFVAPKTPSGRIRKVAQDPVAYVVNSA